VLARLGGVEALAPLDGDFFEFADLSDQFFLLCKLGSLLVLQALSCLLQVFLESVADFALLLLDVGDSVGSLLMLRVDLGNHLLVIL